VSPQNRVYWNRYGCNGPEARFAGGGKTLPRVQKRNTRVVLSWWLRAHRSTERGIPTTGVQCRRCAPEALVGARCGLTRMVRWMRSNEVTHSGNGVSGVPSLLLWVRGGGIRTRCKSTAWQSDMPSYAGVAWPGVGRWEQQQSSPWELWNQAL